MANHGSMDMPAHHQTYAGFLKLIKYSSLTVIVVLIFMALTLT